MRQPKVSYQSKKYTSNTHKVSSRRPFTTDKNNFTTVQPRRFEDFAENKNLTLERKSLIESLNLEIRKNNYIYVEQIPDSNVIVFDSNIRKYRIKSEENSKNPLYGKNVTNLYKRKNFTINNQDISKNINNRYNKSTNYTYNVPNKSAYVDERQIQRGAQRNNDKKCICGRSCECQNSDVINYQRLNKRNTYSTQTKPTSNINRPRIDNKYNPSPRGNTSVNKEIQNNRFDSFSNRTIPVKNRSYRSNTNINKRNYMNNNDNQNYRRLRGDQSNQQENKLLIINRMQKDKDKNNLSCHCPKTLANQESINSNIRRFNNNTNISSNMNQAQSLNKISNYPINTSSISNNRSIKKDYHQNKEIQDLREVSLQQLKNMQSPYKAEEITKDENGEIIKKKEEKTIIILSGQTVEPKSITETFEKPTIEVIQNEDGTSQSIIKQKKIITEIENIPLQNPRNDVDDFQLVKQIITHEYKTLSATNDKLNNKEEKEDERKIDEGKIDEEKEDEEKDERNVEENNNDNLLEGKNELSAGVGDLENKNNVDNKENEGDNKKTNDKKDNEKNLRYMDIVGDDNTQKKNLIKENKNNILSNKKSEAKKDAKGKSTFSEINQKNTNTKNPQATMGKKQSKKDENKNTKSGLTENQKIDKKEKEKTNLANNTLKEKNSNELDKKNGGSNISKSKNKNGKMNKEIQETDLKKAYKKNKEEEKNGKKSDISGNSKIVSELYEKCFKAGNKASEKDLSKIVEILASLGEKERKELLDKLLKAFPKSSELNKKIIILINKSNKLKEKGNKLTSGKESQKESRSKSQIKSDIKKNKLEEDVPKTEINNKVKFAGNRDGSRSSEKIGRISIKNHGVDSLSVNVANIGDLKFDGLFLDISKYQKNEGYDNPFAGPSLFYKFYKIRKNKIKKKIIDMANEAKNNQEQN